MSTPVWSTTAGKLASIDEQVSYSLQLEANTADSTAITYSVIAGSLPSGMELTSAGLLTGIPAEVSKRTRYTFVVRATAGTTITDRNFYLDIEGADAPTFTTASGQLQLDDSSRVGLYWILDGSSLSFQVVASDTDTRAGQSLVYEIVQGALPPGITMSATGLISGIVQLTEDERYGPQGGYAEDYDDYVYDRTLFSKSRSINYDFIVRVSDSTSYVDQDNSIFVYTADYWRVSNSEITVDMNEIGGSALTVDFSANRRPIFKTASDLGTFRHDNACVIKIDVEDFDPLQADLEYSIVSGAMPSGLSINISSGEIYGTLARQTAIETSYTFTIRANRVVSTGINVFTDQIFTMKVIGEIDIGITFTTPATIGTLTADIPSILSFSAVAEETNRVLTYSLTSGSLPTGITLSPQGNLIGTIDPSDFTDSTRAYTFTVTVSDQYQSLATSKEFTLNIDIPYTTIEYGNMTGHSTSFIDQNIFYNIAQDPNINSPEYIYRPEDNNFGMKLNPEMLMMAGLQAQTLTTFQQQMEQNHDPKTLYFGDLKTAVAKENDVIKYEVVYIEMNDKLVNKDGTAISSSVSLRTDVAKPMLGPRAGTVNLTTDMDDFNITTSGGLSFSTAGSKVPYAGQISADLDYMATLYPNAVANMRSRMKTLGHKEWDHLPLWMKTTQSGDLAPLGFVLAVPICYCKAGTSALIKKRITDKGLIFRNIDFIVDRYLVSKSKVTPAKFTGDGSTTTFQLDEIVHEQDILVKEGSNIVYVGDGVTADNNQKPTDLTADGELRSADHEYGIELTHNTSTSKTTVTFTKETPSNGTIITVERANDKYLKFRSKGIF
ncbi:MAG: putative Ig domain-containing protein [Proteobacteria bacterium]|nr:putative Ig domain-containing protein [Pseudomonadota bacterium]